MGDFFTRADWRPSKKRKMQKRIKPYAGAKEANASFLESRKRTQFGSGVHRICSATKRDGNKCGNVALHDRNVCGPHGGFAAWAIKGKLQKTGRSDAFRAVQKALQTNQNQTPQLSALPIYQSANQSDRIRMLKAFGSEAWPAIASQMTQRYQ